MTHHPSRQAQRLHFLAIGAMALALTACKEPQSPRGADAEETTEPDRAFFAIADGTLERPRDYRQWVFVGEPVTPNELNGGKAPFPEFHTVYIDPVSYEAYRSTGQFPDNTILIKELASVGSTSAVSGKGYFMGDFIGLEATIKSKAHFPDEPGNWAYFSFTNPTGGPLAGTAKPFPTKDCNSCHQASAADDFVFTQYYPVLRAAVAEAKGEPAKANNQWQPTGPHPAKAADMPLGRTELHAWLRTGSYAETFAAQEEATHPGRGPHTAPQLPVRVFYNQVLADSLAAGNGEHPKDAIAIKEMHDASGVLAGWAVMAKTGEKSDGGKNWFWYEVTSTTDASAVPAAGNGVPGCASCHAVGSKDLILSGWPLQ
jgi:Cytochrome P460